MVLFLDSYIIISTSRALETWESFPYRSAIDGMLLRHHSIRHGWVCKDHESKPSRTARRTVLHDDDLRYFAIRLEMIPELLLRGLPRNPSYEQLPLIRVHFHKTPQNLCVCLFCLSLLLARSLTLPYSRLISHLQQNHSTPKKMDQILFFAFLSSLFLQERQSTENETQDIATRSHRRWNLEAFARSTSHDCDKAWKP